MKYRWVACVLAALGVLLASLPAQAITFGEADGDRHPNVGALVFRSKEGALYQVCSGTLIAPNIFLTAAHCTAALAELGVVPSGALVTFDPVAGANATLLSGTYYLNPNFGHDMGDLHDVAVVVLDEAVVGVEPARLPPAGLLDQMKEDKTLQETRFVTVGYGVVRDDKWGGPHSLMANIERRYAEQSFLALKPAWIQFSMNPSTGSGGTCYGDSGGPHFLGASNMVVSVTVTGDAFCRATDVTYRLDTESARRFLADFVALP